MNLDDLDGQPDGAALLDELHAALTRYVVLPSPEAADAVVLWTAASHAQPAWQHAPRLALVSPEKRCGKSRCQDIIAETCHRPLVTVNATVAAIVRSLGEDPPTLIVDEADTIFGTKKQAENNEDLRGILNSGHQRRRPMLRWDMTTRSLDELPTFAMACLASKGDVLPDTIMDRAIVVRMRRRARSEYVAKFRTPRDAIPLNDLRDRLREWLSGVEDKLHDLEPDMPVELEDRAEDTWEPLVAIADTAAGDWPTRARKAARVLAAAAAAADNELSLSLRLLDDIREIFTEFTVSFLPSQELVNRLQKVEDAPWSDEMLTTRGLSDRLREFGIRPGRDRTGSVRGYKLEDFEDAFSRYLPTPRQKASDRQNRRSEPDGS